MTRPGARWRGASLLPAALLLLLPCVRAADSGLKPEESVCTLVPILSLGPVGPLPNVTSSDLGLKEGSCAVGDVVYMSGDEFPGSGPCERCACAGGGVRCARQRCEPRPGCKAVHRPDQCCPIYQCECEQEGRVYGNGEKLVDPADPCRVCYCQGGEVVCRRIACFVRDDCRPRAVPGRCCPEYDNCPLRGVTAIPGVAPSPSLPPAAAASSAAPPPPREPVRQEITIKEITPVSEIPVITEVKIKEILPSPAVEVTEYSSSKSPLIVREATSEKTVTKESFAKTDSPIIIEVQPSLSPAVGPSASADSNSIKPSNDLPPSKISLSTQDSINSDIYPPVLTSVPTMGVPSAVPEVVSVAVATKAPVIIEEEDPSLFEHNPAFPPIPDDLSVVGNHEEDVQEQTQYPSNDHVSPSQEAGSAAAAPPRAAPAPQDGPDPATTIGFTNPETYSDPTTVSDATSVNVDTTTGAETTSLKDSPMLNLRSAIPTEILNIPSMIPEDIPENTQTERAAETTTFNQESVQVSTTTQILEKIEISTYKPKTSTETKTIPSSTVIVTEVDTTTVGPTETTSKITSAQTTQAPTTVTTITPIFSTEVTSQTEFSSLPVETSDQNPHEVSENIPKEKTIQTTLDPVAELATTKISPATEAEVITVSRSIPTGNDNLSFENVETTEFVLTSFGSSESATDAVELIKISAEPEKSAPIIEQNHKKNNVLTDLINLVGDVASIGEHTDSPDRAAAISDSEELIPINAGYKSKNNNWNVNSITEIPVKSKSQAVGTKQRVVEIEGDDTETITDLPPPHDRVEPTTRRAIIDNVSDDKPGNKTENKDIEIITKSYVPTINRRPTKVIMKKSNDERLSADEPAASAAPSPPSPPAPAAPPSPPSPPAPPAPSAPSAPSAAAPAH